jgi:hypothetical protein
MMWGVMMERIKDRREVSLRNYQLFANQCAELEEAIKTFSPPMNKVMALGKFESKTKNYFICFRPPSWGKWMGSRLEGVYWSMRLPALHETKVPMVRLYINVNSPMKDEWKTPFKRTVIDEARNSKMIPEVFSTWPQAGQGGSKLIERGFPLGDNLAKEVTEQLKETKLFSDLVADTIAEYAREHRINVTVLFK